MKTPLFLKKWLEEKLYNIIFQKENPKALGFLTNFWNILNNSQFKVSEIVIVNNNFYYIQGHY